ncbi:MAG: hypothetical protein LBL44_09350, partial [Treponema sp.]|jgi:hypothetical protein|nr:hypothetical protein [Treponema sp.]
VPTGPTGGIAGSNGGTIGNCAALNSKVNNTNTSMNYQGRISGFGSGTYSFNHAYALMQLDSYTTPISGSTAASSNGADIAAPDLASSGSLTLWTGDSTKLDWPTFQTAATSGEPAGSPWHWYKTITIPANGISGSGITTAYVPALWFEE